MYIKYCILRFKSNYILVVHSGCLIMENTNTEDESVNKSGDDDMEYSEGESEDDDSYLRNIDERLRNLNPRDRQDRREIKALRDTKRSILMDKLDKKKKEENWENDQSNKRKIEDSDSESSSKKIDTKSEEKNSDSDTDKGVNTGEKIDTQDVDTLPDAKDVDMLPDAKDIVDTLSNILDVIGL